MVINLVQPGPRRQKKFRFRFSVSERSDKRYYVCVRDHPFRQVNPSSISVLIDPMDGSKDRSIIDQSIGLICG